MLWGGSTAPHPGKAWKWTKPSAEDEVSHFGHAGLTIQSLVGTGGSYKFGRRKCIAKGGWAVAACPLHTAGEAKNLHTGVGGPLPFPEPSILLAELWVVVAMKLLTPPSQLLLRVGLAMVCRWCWLVGW